MTAENIYPTIEEFKEKHLENNSHLYPKNMSNDVKEKLIKKRYNIRRLPLDTIVRLIYAIDDDFITLDYLQEGFKRYIEVESPGNKGYDDIYDYLGSSKGEELDYLNTVRSSIQEFTLTIEEFINSKIDVAIERDKSNKVVEFYEQFPEDLIFTKVKIYNLTGYDKSWLHKNPSLLENFDNSRQGINVYSFLKWLKIYSPKNYQYFIDNYEA